MSMLLALNRHVTTVLTVLCSSESNLVIAITDVSSSLIYVTYIHLTVTLSFFRHFTEFQQIT